MFRVSVTKKPLSLVDFNPIDPKPAISAVFPQSSHICPEKTAVFQKVSTLKKINRTNQRVKTAQYVKLKPLKSPIKYKRNNLCRDNPLNLDVFPKC